MKTIITTISALLGSPLFGAEYLHLRNERDTPTTYAVHGVAGIRQVSLKPKESVSIRFPAPEQKVELVTSGGLSSGRGRDFIVEANASPEIGSIVQNDFSAYPVLSRVIEVSVIEGVVRIEERNEN